MASLSQIPPAFQHFRKENLNTTPFMAPVAFQKSPSPPLSDDDGFNDHKIVDEEERRPPVDDVLTTAVKVQADTSINNYKKLRDDVSPHR